jgi:hypothetical protein
MVGISKNESEKLMEDFLISGSTIDTSREFAMESMNILNDKNLRQILMGSLIIKLKDSIDEKRLNEEKDMRFFMTNIVNAMLIGCTEKQLKTCSRENKIPVKFKNCCSEDPLEDWENPKLKFAFDQFVSAFTAFEIFEKKYPKIVKII